MKNCLICNEINFLVYEKRSDEKNMTEQRNYSTDFACLTACLEKSVYEWTPMQFVIHSDVRLKTTRDILTSTLDTRRFRLLINCQWCSRWSKITTTNLNLVMSADFLWLIFKINKTARLINLKENIIISSLYYTFNPLHTFNPVRKSFFSSLDIFLACRISALGLDLFKLFST